MRRRKLFQRGGDYNQLPNLNKDPHPAWSSGPLEIMEPYLSSLNYADLRHQKTFHPHGKSNEIGWKPEGM